MGVFIPQSVTISNTGGTTSATTYLINDRDSLASAINIAAIEGLIDRGETIVNGYEGTFEFLCGDVAILSDARLQISAGTIPTQLARLVFTSATGGQIVTIDNLRLAMINPYEVVNNRRFIRVKATITTIASPIVVTTA